MGGSISVVVNADVVLPTPEAGCRRGQLASFSCVWTLDPPAPNFLAAMRKSKSDAYLVINLITYQHLQHVYTKTSRGYISLDIYKINIKL